MCVCLCLWLHAAFICLPTLPRVCFLGTDQNLLGLSDGGGGAGVVDVVMTCMTLEKDVVIVLRPSPWGRWLVLSCIGGTGQTLSICTLPHCGTFPHGVSTATLTSFVNVHPAHHRGVLGGSNYLHSHTVFCVFFHFFSSNMQQPTKKECRRYNVEQGHESWMAAH